MHVSEATSIIIGITDENEDIIDLTVGRVQEYSSEDAIDDTMLSEELAETFRASLTEHRYLEAPRSPITECVHYRIELWICCCTQFPCSI